MQVRVYKNNVSKAIAILNRKLREDGDNARALDRRHYIKPSERRRLDKKRSTQRVHKQRMEAVKEGGYFDGRGISKKTSR